MKFLLYILLITFLFWLDLASGSTGWLDVSVSDLWNGELSTLEHTILLDVRLPAAITAMMAGAGLAIAGLMMQVLFNNPLAGPGVMGVSSGAGLFVSFAVLAGIGSGIGLAFMSIIGSLLMLLLIILASMRLASNTSLLILGLMIGYVATALISVLQYSAEADRLQQFVFWSLGSFQAVSWDGISVLVPVIILSLILTFLMRSKLDVMLLGETQMHSLGYDPAKARLPLLLLTGAIVGIVTAYCGPLAFIGLAAPHIARMISPSDLNARMIPHTIFIGMIIGLAACYVVSAPWIGFQLPLNAVLSIFGAPVVIWLLMRNSHLSQVT